MKKLCAAMLALVLVVMALAAMAEPTLNIVEEELTLYKGKSGKLTIETTDIPAKEKVKVTYTTEDKAVATAASGKVTAKGAGKTVITATATLKDGTVISDSCDVTVQTQTKSIKFTTKSGTVYGLFF